MRKKQEESNNHTTAVTLNKLPHIQYLSAGLGGQRHAGVRHNLMPLPVSVACELQH